MKKSAYIITGLIVAILVAISGCDKFRQYTNFDLGYTQQFTIPASSQLINLPFNVLTPDVTTNSESQYDNNGTTSKLVDNVTLTRFNLAINSPSQASFDFLKSLKIYISSPSQAEVLVAYNDNIPQTGLRSLDLTTRDVNLNNYLQDASYKIRVEVVTDQSVSYDVTVTASETFHVKAKLKNLFKK